MSLRDLQVETEELKVLRSLTLAYAQIAALKMKHTREGVLKSREFVGSLTTIFDEVRASYKRQVEKLAKKRRAGKARLPDGQAQKLTFLAHNGRTVAAYLSANTGLYGEIVPKTFGKFLQEAMKPEVEATIVGKLGRSLWLESGTSKPYTYFELPDYGIEAEKLAEVIKHLVQYERVLLVYGQYQGMAKQEPVVAEVGAEGIDLERTLGAVERLQYYFEPTLEEILQFFEGEMFGAFVEQVVREGQLAKFASRMVAMDRANSNVQKRLEEWKLKQLKFRHERDNRKLNQLFAGVGVW